MSFELAQKHAKNAIIVKGLGAYPSFLDKMASCGSEQQMIQEFCVGGSQATGENLVSVENQGHKIIEPERK